MASHGYGVQRSAQGDQEKMDRRVPWQTRPPPPNVAVPSAHGQPIVDVDGGKLLADIPGMLGVVETIVFLVYATRGLSSKTNYETVLFSLLAIFDFMGFIVATIVGLKYMSANADSRFDSIGNRRTATRDHLHNLVYPRSAVRSRKRRDFAAIAWFGVLVAIIPVLFLLSYYPVWRTQYDESPLNVRLGPSIFATVALFQGVGGMVLINRRSGCNESTYLLVTFYAYMKLMSVYVLTCGGSRLLWGAESGVVGAVVGLLTVALQLVEIASAFFASFQYFGDLEDEDMPELHKMGGLLCYHA